MQLEMFSLKDKTILITGATGHLGSELAFGLATAGAKVLVNSRSESDCENLCNKILQKNLIAEPAVFDVTKHKEVRRFFANKKSLQLDCLINNAYSGKSGTIINSIPENYSDSYLNSVISAHIVFVNALPALRKAVKKNHNASVINIASMYGVVSPDIQIYHNNNNANPPFYGAAKAGLIQWSRYAACEFGCEGIRVNALSPGAFPSDSIINKDTAFIKKLKQKIPLGRVGKAIDLVGPILFLCSNASNYVNGANIIVDGGWTSW